MSGQSNNKIIFGGAAGLLAVVALVWFVTRSGSAVEPNSPTPQRTVTMTEDEPAESATRSKPRGATGGTRLEGVAAAEENEADEGVTQKSKSKRTKKRQRRKQESDEEEEEEKSAKQGKKERVFGK